MAAEDEKPADLYAVWPDVSRSCFAPGADAKLNACVTFALNRPDPLTPYAQGYRKAAEALFERAQAGGVSPDVLVFPLAFLWRQHIELALKQIEATGRQLDGKPWGFAAGHCLNVLWSIAKGYVRRLRPDAREVEHVEERIRELQAIDPESDGFRYPLDREGNARSLPDIADLVSLENLCVGLAGVANFLNAAQMELARELEHQAEASRFQG